MLSWFTFENYLTSSYIFQEKEFRLSEVFHIVKDDDGNDVLAMSEVNKYAYSTEDNATIDSTVVEFEPLPHNEPDRLEVGTEEELHLMLKCSNCRPVLETEQSMTRKQEEVDKMLDETHRDDTTVEDVDDFELTNEIPATTAREQDNMMSGKTEHGGGYYESSGPKDFMKKKYKSELLHVS